MQFLTADVDSVQPCHQLSRLIADFRMMIDAQTLREYDATCPPPVRSHTAEEAWQMKDAA